MDDSGTHLALEVISEKGNVRTRKAIGHVTILRHRVRRRVYIGTLGGKGNLCPKGRDARASSWREVYQNVGISLAQYGREVFYVGDSRSNKGVCRDKAVG